MMVSWLDVVVGQERRKDLLREAEQDRLVRQARARHDRGTGFPRRSLSWLGSQLVAWGQHLQEGYGGAVDTPGLKAANRTG